MIALKLMRILFFKQIRALELFQLSSGFWASSIVLFIIMRAGTWKETVYCVIPGLVAVIYNKIFKSQRYWFWFVHPAFTVKKKNSLVLKGDLTDLMLSYSVPVPRAGCGGMTADREAKLSEVTFGFILRSPAGAATTLSVSQSLPRAGGICTVSLQILWGRDYPGLSAYQLCSSSL